MRSICWRRPFWAHKWPNLEPGRCGGSRLGAPLDSKPAISRDLGSSWQLPEVGVSGSRGTSSKLMHDLPSPLHPLIELSPLAARKTTPPVVRAQGRDCFVYQPLQKAVQTLCTTLESFRSLRNQKQVPSKWRAPTRAHPQIIFLSGRNQGLCSPDFGVPY